MTLEHSKFGNRPKRVTIRAISFATACRSTFCRACMNGYKAAYYDPVANVYYNFPTGSDTAPLSVTGGAAPGTAVYQQIGPADITLAGGLSPYGTMAQGGNVAEWNEAVFGLDFMHSPNLGARGFRGGDYAHFSSELRSTHASSDIGAASEFLSIGFRIASIIPEPSAVALLGIGLLGIPGLRLRASIERRRHDA